MGLITCFSRGSHIIQHSVRPQNINLLIKLHLARALADVEVELALSDDPILADDIPVAEIAPQKLKGDGLRLVGLKVHLFEAAELLGGRACGGGGGKAEVELGDCGTADLAGVGDADGDVVERGPEVGVAAGLGGLLDGEGGDVGGEWLGGKVGVVKGGVAEAEAEFVADRDVVGVEVAVVNFELLVEPGLPVIVAGGVDGRGGRSIIVAAIKSDSVWEMAGGIHVAVEDVDKGVAGFFAGEVCGKDGGDVLVVSPGEHVDAGRVSDNDSVVALRCDRLDDGVAVPVDVKRGTVSTFLSPCF